MSKLIKINIAIVLAFIFYSFSIETRAEVVMFQNLMRDYAITNIQNHALYSPNTSSNNKKYSNDIQKKNKDVLIYNNDDLKFNSSAEQRKKNIAIFVAKTRQSDAVSADQLQQMFASTDVIDLIGKGIAPYGLRTDNLADAYAVYWANAWLGSRGRNDDFDKRQILAVRNQAANALLATPAVVSASNSQKQEMAEALLVQAALIGYSVESAKSDPALMSKVKAAIAQGAKAMGLDLYTMTLTDNGFVPAKKSSAVDEGALVPDDEAEEQALASTAPPPWYDSTNYTLIAAAGGAGLGGMFLLGKVMGRKS